MSGTLASTQATSADEDMQKRLARLEHAADIRDLKARYARACDDGYDPEAVGALFTDAATWERPDDGVLHRGRSGIMAAMAQNGRKYSWSSHMLSEPRVEVRSGTPITGHGIWPMLCLLQRPGVSGSMTLVSGFYEDEFELMSGRWYIRRLVVRVVRSAELKMT